MLGEEAFCVKILLKSQKVILVIGLLILWNTYELIMLIMPDYPSSTLELNI
jgi:hypothetical protein